MEFPSFRCTHRTCLHAVSAAQVRLLFESFFLQTAPEECHPPELLLSFSSARSSVIPRQALNDFVIFRLIVSVTKHSLVYSHSLLETVS